MFLPNIAYQPQNKSNNAHKYDRIISLPRFFVEGKS